MTAELIVLQKDIKRVIADVRKNEGFSKSKAINYLIVLAVPAYNDLRRKMREKQIEEPKIKGF